ncbi:helix-turn-helix domain-containing protein [Kineococcus auxinigenes]|uniref:helix-turn-helix domain-containing protein n=1 Tax=unclassified Kineococcus TaxID=2621656 RepID=UPI003D7CE6FB
MAEPDTLVSAGSDPDPAVGLRAVAALRRLVEQLEHLQVQRARDLGWSWADIAGALGVSKQAAHRKHSTRD